MSAQGNVIVWINAFIPRDVPGVTKAITPGTNGGKTAIPLPWYAKWELFNRYKNALDPHDRGFLTDQRSFSSDMTASVRMQTNAQIRLYPPSIVSYDHWTSGTKEVDVESGETLGIEIADMSDCSIKGPYRLPIPEFEGAARFRGEENILEWFDSLLLKHRVALNVYSFHKRRHSHEWFWVRIPKPGDSFAVFVEVSGAASDPLVHWAPNIDYVVDFVIVVDAQKKRLLVVVFGNISDFPAFEAYAKYNGVTKTLFQHLPPSGNTPWDLIGDAQRRVLAAVSFAY